MSAPPPSGPPPGALPPGVRPPPPGAFPPGQGPPPGALPPGVKPPPPGAFPPGQGPPPGALPPGVRPPPPGAFPPGQGPPPGALPPGVRPPPPGAFPPGQGPPPGAFPPGQGPPPGARPPPPGAFPPGQGPPPGAFPPGQGPPPGARPPPPGALPPGQGPPPGSFPPGQGPPPGALPPGARPPPPGAFPPGQGPPPGAFPPGQGPPPGARPPPPGAFPPGQGPPPGALPPGARPPGGPVPPAAAAPNQFNIEGAKAVSAAPKVAARTQLAFKEKADDSNIKDLWTIVLEENEKSKSSAVVAEGQTNDDNEEDKRECTFVFLGQRQSGKSSLTQSVLTKDRESNKPVPSSCLGYTYARIDADDKAEPTKTLTHFYELGGGSSLLKLLDVCVTPDNIHNTHLCITLDVSKPSRLIEDLSSFIDEIQKHTESILARLQMSKSPLSELLKNSAQKRLALTGSDKPTNFSTNTLLIPTVVLANKYDLICNDFTPDQLKVLSRTLRSICHKYGLSLLYTTTFSPSSTTSTTLQKERESSLKLYRNKIHSFVRGPLPQETSKKLQTYIQTESTSIIHMLAGFDTNEAIGEAPEKVPRGDSTESWIAYYKKIFPKDASEKSESLLLEEPKLPAETTVDAVLAQKEEDLKRVRREMELRRKLTNVDVTSSSSSATSASSNKFK